MKSVCATSLSLFLSFECAFFLSFSLSRFVRAFGYHSFLSPRSHTQRKPSDLPLSVFLSSACRFFSLRFSVLQRAIAIRTERGWKRRDEERTSTKGNVQVRGKIVNAA